MPSRERPRPTGVKSNMPNGWPASSWRNSETMMLGDVPMSVMSPPNNEPNAIGMRNTDGDTLERFAIWKATGSIMASAPMFFTKADSTVTVVTSRMSCARTEEMRGPRACSAPSMRRDRVTAALTRSAAATMTRMSLLNPENAWSNGTTPTRMATSSASAATRS